MPRATISSRGSKSSRPFLRAATTLVVALACAALAATGVAPLRAAIAPVPTLLLALALVARPVPPTSNRKIGCEVRGDSHL